MTVQGEIIKGQFGQEFMLSLENKDIAQIPAGDYIIMIDPIWDESVFNDKSYREIMIDIFCPLST